MATITWDAVADRKIENGVRHGVLFVGSEGKAVAWNGLTSVSLKPEGAEVTDLYADNMKYASMMSKENLKASIEAYTYPDAFAECDGSITVGNAKFDQQKRKKFSFAYETNEIDGDGNETAHLHVIYGCLASPSERQYQTVNDSPEAMTFSWEISCDLVPCEHGGKEYYTSHVEVKVTAGNKAALEALVFDDTKACPTPAELLAAAATNAA